MAHRLFYVPLLALGLLQLVSLPVGDAQRASDYVFLSFPKNYPKRILQLLAYTAIVCSLNRHRKWAKEWMNSLLFQESYPHGILRFRFPMIYRCRAHHFLLLTLLTSSSDVLFRSSSFVVAHQQIKIIWWFFFLHCRQ